ncbi:MAG: glycosyltransferase family 2 protein, partial [Chlamydiae bacterium]|nr:glycosyltransferase family 2 protein [Chlamydiota bacterium]
MNVPFFSLVILGRGPLHLLSHTIESIKSQKEKDFEVIFISPSKTSLRLDPDVPVEWFFTKEKELAGMMNEGLSLTRGKY